MILYNFFGKNIKISHSSAKIPFLRQFETIHNLLPLDGCPCTRSVRGGGLLFGYLEGPPNILGGGFYPICLSVLWLTPKMLLQKGAMGNDVLMGGLLMVHWRFPVHFFFQSF